MKLEENTLPAGLPICEETPLKLKPTRVQVQRFVLTLFGLEFSRTIRTSWGGNLNMFFMPQKFCNKSNMEPGKNFMKVKKRSSGQIMNCSHMPPRTDIK